MAFSFRAGTNWCHDFPKLARESGFHFNMHRRKVRVDWNRISSIDINRVIGERDFSTLDENVNNVVDYCLESEYDVKILDANFVKLFRLAQLAVEYLLYCKQYLDHSVVILKEELKCKIEENAALKRERAEDEKTIKELREKLKDRNRIVETKLGDSHGEIHKCPHCPKTFISAAFVSSHVARRHGNSSRGSALNSPVHEQYRAETEKLHSEIKTLKERLNLTERVIRNESEQFLSSESALSNDNRLGNRGGESSEAKIHRDEMIEEQHRRYQQEIGNLKATLFDEIRNLKFASREKAENDERTDASSSKLLNEKEKEIQLLRQQLAAKPSLEELEARRGNQELLWQSKMNYLEERYRADMEKVYGQLRANQENADRMRNDYLTRISELERREASLESTIQARNAKISRIQEVESVENDEKPSRTRESTKKQEIQVEEISSDESSEENEKKVPLPGNSKDFGKSIEKRVSSTPKSPKKMSSALNNSKKMQRYKTEVSSSGKNQMEKNVDKKQEFLNGGISVCRRLSSESDEPSPIRPGLKAFERPNKSISNENVRSSEKKIHERKKNLRKIEDDSFGKSKKPFSPSNNSRKIVDDEEKASIDESQESESDFSLESESYDDSSESQENSDSEEVDSSKNRADRKTENSREIATFHGERDENGMELFYSRLRDLGIDPEWRGIPDATFRQIMEIVKHHRNINSKKYRKFEELRRKLTSQLNRKLAIKEKHEKIEHTNEQTQFGKLVTNVKSRVSKALTILDKNDGSYSARLVSSTPRQPQRHRVSTRKIPESPIKSPIRSPIKSPIIRGKKVRQGVSSVRRDSVNSDEESGKKNREARLYENSEAKNEGKNDLKHFSHSYESIKDFIKDTTNRTHQKSIFNMPNLDVTKFPIGDSSVVNDDNSLLKNEKKPENSSYLSLNSPRNNNKSVLKSTTGGSVGSLVKKKVFFDLEAKERSVEGEKQLSMYPTRERDFDEDSKSLERANQERDTSGSDFEISSIYDDVNEPEKLQDEETSSKKIVFKTSQSAKIAEISKEIEKQLSITRRKPAGAVEAMFAEKFPPSKDNFESPMNGSSALSGDTKRSNFPSLDTENAENRGISRENRISVGPNAQNRDSDSNATNLDRDIDELLRID